MARATKTTRPSGRRTPDPVPRKRPGRPLGSKNKVAAVTKANIPPVARTARQVRKTPAVATPRLNKAELEAQVVKLERTIARLRKQNTELKQAAREEARDATQAASAPGPTSTKRAAAAAPRRNARTVADPAAPEPEDAPAVTAAAGKTSRRTSRSRTPRAAKSAAEHEDPSSEDHADEAAPEA